MGKLDRGIRRARAERWPRKSAFSVDAGAILHRLGAADVASCFIGRKKHQRRRDHGASPPHTSSNARTKRRSSAEELVQVKNSLSLRGNVIPTR
jgi:hypothetical protein